MCISDTVDEDDDLYDFVEDEENEGDEIYEDLMRTEEQPETVSGCLTTLCIKQKGKLRLCSGGFLATWRLCKSHVDLCICAFQKCLKSLCLLLQMLSNSTKDWLFCFHVF